MRKLKRPIAMAAAFVMAFSMQVGVAQTAAVVSAAQSAQNGLRGDYWFRPDGDNNSVTFTNYMLTQIDNNIDVSDMVSALTQITGRGTYVSVRWTGWIKTPPAADGGVYRFSAATDDCLRLWIGNVSDADTPVVNWWGNQWCSSPTDFRAATTGTITLQPDTYYPFRMDYSQGYGGAFARLRWAKTTGSGQFADVIIPASAFYLDDAFKPALITDLDTSGIDQNGQGTVKMGVTGFTPNTTLGLMATTDVLQQSVTPISYTLNGGVATVTLPAGLAQGYYKFIATESGVKTLSPVLVTQYVGGTPRAEYPRPDYARDYAWDTLNGTWDFKFNRQGLDDTGWENGFTNPRKILVPYPWQSPLSGICDTTEIGGVAWYFRNFTPGDKYAGKRIYIKFGAVDAECWLYVNGTYVGYHNGGYTPFEYDVTNLVTVGQEAKIALKVRDLGRSGDSYTALLGKQGWSSPVGYTSTSGIWQSVIMEGRYSATQMRYVHVDPLVGGSENVVPKDGQAKFKVTVTGGSGKTLTLNYNFNSVVWDDTNGVNIINSGGKASAITGSATIAVPAGADPYEAAVTVAVPNQQLWSPDTPNLYDGEVKLYDGTALMDDVKMYFGQRSIGNDFWPTSNNAYKYTLLNNKPVFEAGLLDQGFWPAGVYTAPTEAALKSDIKDMRDLGFNMIRKHIKIEDPLQYFWCDRLGMMVWQDMPWATNMTSTSDKTGRALYENALADLINRDYNHPGKIAYILFNETWGVDRVPDTANWITSLYNSIKASDTSGRLVEDMSPCNYDHLNPTDQNTFHMYPGNYTDAKNMVDTFDSNVYIGSTYNYNQWGFPAGTYKQDGAPWLNSEFGGVASGSGDMDISWCFKYQLDIQRLRQKLQGYAYTEPFDVEYERNGMLKYDRSHKVLGYDEIAYGGDMSAKFLNQADYVGVNKTPIVTLAPGDTYSATIGAIRWSDKATGPFTLKWRVDGTDQFGNKIDTSGVPGFRGQAAINYAPYVYETKPMSFIVPAEGRFSRFAGTVTVWVEDGSGATIAKNFVNFKVLTGSALPVSEKIGDNSYVLRQATPTANTNTGTVAGAKTGGLTYQYALPSGFDIDGLTSLNLTAELSAAQKLSTNGNVNARPQTAIGYETPSDVTVSVNGHEIGTVNLPDAPCDMRGTMSLDAGSASETAGFGYLVNLNLDRATVASLKDELKASPTLTVKYEVKTTAAHQNGVRAFVDTAGRYPVNPSVVLNPPVLYYQAGPQAPGTLALSQPLTGADYSVEADVNGAASISAGYSVAVSGNNVTLSGNGANKAYDAGVPVSHVKVTFFDQEVRVYVNNNPQPAIDVYGKTGAGASIAVTGALSNVTVLPETIVSASNVLLTGRNTQFVESFNTANNWKWDGSVRGTWSNAVATNNYRMPFPTGTVAGGILFNNAITVGDATVAYDINFNGATPAANNNAGMVLRSQPDYSNASDAANGIYVGIGSSITSPNISGGFLQCGRVAGHGWSEILRTQFPAALGAFDNAKTYRVKTVMNGPRYTVYINDVFVADFYDSTYTSGSVVLRDWNCTSGWFDNIVVSAAPDYSATFTSGSAYTTSNLTGYNYNGTRTDEWQTYGTWAAENQAFRASGAGAALTGNDTWANQSASVKLNLNADSAAGLVVRATGAANKANGFAAVADSAASTVTLGQLSDGGFTALKTVNAYAAAGSDGTLRVTASGDVISVYYNDSVNPVITYAYGAGEGNATGKIGLVCLRGGALFDDVSATDKFVMTEKFGPRALDGWQNVGGNWSVNGNALSIPTGTDNKLVGLYADLSDYTVDFDYRFDSRDTTAKNNGTIILRGTDFGSGQDQMKGYVIGLGTNTINSVANVPLLEFGDLLYGWRLIKDLNQSNTPGLTADMGRWYHFKIVTSGARVQIYLDNAAAPIIDVTDTAQGYSFGQIGFRNFHAGVSFKNLVLTPAGAAVPDRSDMVLTASAVGGKLVAKLENYSGAACAAKLIAGVYMNGRLVHTEALDRAVEPGLALVQTFALSTVDYPGCEFKVFAWDAASFAPLCAAADIGGAVIITVS